MKECKIRCRLSKLGLSTFENNPHKRGTVIPYKRICQGLRNNLIRVRWDGKKTMLEYHPDFIDLIKN